jgi:hypothetical protein
MRGFSLATDAAFQGDVAMLEELLSYDEDLSAR